MYIQFCCSTQNLKENLLLACKAILVLDKYLNCMWGKNKSLRVLLKHSVWVFHLRVYEVR